MKRISYMIITVLTMFIFNIFVNAASANLSVSSNSVYVGDTFTISVNMASSAAWNIHVSSSGPVSGCSINQADATADAMDTNKTFSATCTATGTGTITIRLSGDVTSASDGNDSLSNRHLHTHAPDKPRKPYPDMHRYPKDIYAPHPIGSSRPYAQERISDPESDPEHFCTFSESSAIRRDTRYPLLHVSPPKDPDPSPFLTGVCSEDHQYPFPDIPDGA